MTNSNEKLTTEQQLAADDKEMGYFPPKGGKGPSPCQCCGRAIKKRPLYGKLRYPHKCPHGNWCPAGGMLTGMHANGPQWGSCCAGR